MKKLLLLIGVAGLLGSCAISRAPLTGTIYTDMKYPVAVTDNSGSSKVGTASAQFILGFTTSENDASVETAAKKAGITKIHHVDAQITSVLGVYATYEIFVYGE